ncbi:MAG: calcium-binding protein [Solirubrobacteraceae bacterium]
MSRARVALAVGMLLVLSPAAAANTSHQGWPRIDMLLMNKTDRSRPLDARPGFDPFGGQDSRYSCDAVHLRGSCQRWFEAGAGGGRVVGPHKLHSELLGGHGDDELHAGAFGDVLWADYKPSGQPTTQRDLVFGGAGNDFIYASHGYNDIEAGGGDDYVKAHFGHGVIDCGGGTDTLYISRRAQRHYRVRRCDRISHRTLGY